MRSSLRRAFITLLAVPCVAGCAARTPAPGVLPVELYIAQVRQASGMARAAVAKTQLPTVERTDPGLAAAVAALNVFPSVERQMEVGVAYWRLGITDKAHEYFTLAARTDRRNAVAYDALARLWRDWGFPALGLLDAHRAVYFAPASPEARNTLGTVLQRLGRYAEARISYEGAARLNPMAAYAFNNLCTLDLLEGRPQSAADNCSRALALDPHLLVAQQNLDRAYALLAVADSGNQYARH